MKVVVLEWQELLLVVGQFVMAFLASADMMAP